MSIPWDVVFNCLLIIGARVADVSLGTLRTVSVVNGRRNIAWALGFFEVLIWILVVSQVVKNINDSKAYPIAYAAGFALGNFIGMTIESRVAYGEQVVRVFSRAGDAIAGALRHAGMRVTEFDGRGRDGPVQMLFIETTRKSVPFLLRRVRELDPQCFYVVDDIRIVSANNKAREPGGWLSVFKHK